MTRFVLLFGAGASYGSDTSGTPPLGDGLFEALRQFNPGGWGALPQTLASQFRSDFEAGMVELSRLNSHAMPPLQRAMAAYFFNFVPRTTNLYFALARKIRSSHWEGALATLNYERLLEISLTHAGIQPVVGQANPSDNKIELCLPHGCCHIFCEGVRASGVGVSFSGVGITSDGPVTVIADPTDYQNRIIGDAFPPVMSYFEPQKTTTSGVSFIRGQRDRWRQLVESAEIVGLVGVKLRVSDLHIWEPVARTSAKVIYCSGKSGGAEFESWSRQTRPDAKDKVLYGYFQESFDALCYELAVT